MSLWVCTYTTCQCVTTPLFYDQFLHGFSNRYRVCDYCVWAKRFSLCVCFQDQGWPHSSGHGVDSNDDEDFMESGSGSGDNNLPDQAGWFITLFVSLTHSKSKNVRRTASYSLIFFIAHRVWTEKKSTVSVRQVHRQSHLPDINIHLPNRKTVINYQASQTASLEMDRPCAPPTGRNSLQNRPAMDSWRKES